MNPERTGDVLVVVAPRGATDAADRHLLAAAAAWVLGVDPRTVSIERTCERCGGSHGRPVVAVPPGAAGPTPLAGPPHAAPPPPGPPPLAGPPHAGPPHAGPLHAGPLHASLSRAADSVAIALTFAGPVGIDIESVEAVSRADFDQVAFGASELSALRSVPPADASWARAVLWTAKEAVLKCTGAGLRVDPRGLTVTLPDAGDPDAGTESGTAAAPRLAAWPGAGFPLDTMRLARFDPGPGLAGTVAVRSDAGHSDAGHTETGPRVLQLTHTDIRRRPGPRLSQSLGSAVR
ncbi:MAG: 4'-phosphopantetheinyl transferase superfamily protein [Ramlibacter sp.]|nr:4'-phosphopantetheinyl transferase superfamily protein [Cryobacterium sp.]